MKIQKNKKGVFVKKLSEIDNYFLNILKRFFETDAISFIENKENIINEAVKRAKEDFKNSPGAILVTRVNGMSGNVTLTAKHVGAEPALLKRGTAYNKNFGDKKGQVCEGNDPRLSDAREPLEHDHDDEYIKKSEIDKYIEKWLLDNDIVVSKNEISVYHKDLHVHNGVVKEL